MIASKYFVGGGLWKLLSMAPSKDHTVGDLLIVAKLEFIWFTCCILMDIHLFISSARPLKSIFALF
jgi:hypothetical protein